MTRSFRSEKESSIARRNIPRGTDGIPVLPRVIERRPYPGDVHPLSRKSLGKLLCRISETYVYGLSRIELRARDSKKIGEPFGVYLRDEKAILLYSLPKEWHLQSIEPLLELMLRKFYATINKSEDQVIVRWPCDALMSLWFYCEVFTHELGHHFRNQYRHKRKRGGNIEEELVACLHAKRFTDMLFKDFKKRKT